MDKFLLKSDDKPFKIPNKNIVVLPIEFLEEIIIGIDDRECYSNIKNNQLDTYSKISNNRLEFFSRNRNHSYYKDKILFIKYENIEGGLKNQDIFDEIIHRDLTSYEKRYSQTRMIVPCCFLENPKAIIFSWIESNKNSETHPYKKNLFKGEYIPNFQKDIRIKYMSQYSNPNKQYESWLTNDELGHHPHKFHDLINSFSNDSIDSINFEDLIY